MADGQPKRRLPPGLEHATTAVVFALWIAISAAAPELLWQGGRRSFGGEEHLDFLSPLLFGLMSVFFIEPLIHGGRSLIEGHPHDERDLAPWSPLVRFGVGFAFGLGSMFVHEAFNGFLHASESGGHDDVGPKAAIMLTLAWAITPFTIALAWETARKLWIGVPLGVVAAVSPVITGWLFDWTLPYVVTSAIPSLFILGFGYWRLKRTSRRLDFARLAPVVAVVGVVWLGVAAIFDTIAQSRGSALADLYDWESLLIDLRFYIGWTLGLLLGAKPAPTQQASHRAGSPFGLKPRLCYSDPTGRKPGGAAPKS